MDIPRIISVDPEMMAVEILNIPLDLSRLRRGLYRFLWKERHMKEYP
jgi:hypothetical protein